jgi:formylglycine-generating enzyme required for sulfatase activity
MSSKKKRNAPAAAAPSAVPPDAVGRTAVPSAASARPVGLVLVVGLMLALALAWGTLRAPGAATSAEPAPFPGPPDALPGFRTAAWLLPDDSLLGFVEIPGGLFLMGSSPTDSLAFPNEHWADGTGPASVQVETFWIGRDEVTVAQLRAFAAATGYHPAAEALNGEPDHPAGSVSWTDAVAYARWLEEQMKASPATPARLAELLRSGWHVTLPTEAQWEKAARGTDGRVYPWGNEPRTDLANFQGSATKAVGSVACAECAYGLSDMSGNVWELTRTPYRDGPHDPRLQQADLAADALWVMRGGSFADPARNVRAAIRGGADPGVRRPNIGFRLVISRE